MPSSLSSSSSSISRQFPYRSRQASFLALQELKKKLYYALSQGLNVNCNDGSIQGRTPTPVKSVSHLPCYPPSSYLKPGTFLLTHPLIHGFFSQTVVIILDHTDDLPSSTPSCSSAMAVRGGAYGLIINKPAMIRKRLNTSAAAATWVETATVSDIFRNKLSVNFNDAFYDSAVCIGGPVHSSYKWYTNAARITNFLYNLAVEYYQKFSIGRSRFYWWWWWWSIKSNNRESVSLAVNDGSYRGWGSKISVFLGRTKYQCLWWVFTAKILCKNLTRLSLKTSS
jgi:hypothetical protein